MNLGYYDGNTVTALWNYAQYFAMSDNSYSTTFGPSTPGAMNLISGQTNGVSATLNGTGDEVNGGSDGSLTLINDADPIGDVCSSPTRDQAQMGGKNIGDLLNAANLTWGSFMGGFNLSIVNPNQTTGCSRSSAGLSGTTADFIPHHAWFQYYASTANPNHTRPASTGEIGHNGPANHGYDYQDFLTAVQSGHIPAVSFVKAPAYQDAHAGYSNPLDEQTFVVTLVNLLMQQPYWNQTAVFSFLCMAALCYGGEAPGFKVTHKYPVPGNGWYDYIAFDGSSNRLYVSHGTEVDVLDANSGKVLGKVADTQGVHGIAIVPALHRGFTTNGNEATVSVFDTDSFQTLRKIPVDKDPDFIAFDTHSGHILVCHGDAAAITAIDPEKESVIGKIDLGGGAEAAAIDASGNGFVNLEEQAMVVSFDPQNLSVKQKYPITGCKTPTGLAMDTQNGRLFIGCRSKVLAVMNSQTGKVIATLPIGGHVDGVVFDADRRLVFCSNGDGTVSVIRRKALTSTNPWETFARSQAQEP